MLYTYTHTLQVVIAFKASARQARTCGSTHQPTHGTIPRTQHTTHKGTHAKHIPEDGVGLLVCMDLSFVDYSQWMSFILLSPHNLLSVFRSHQSTNTHRMLVDTCSARKWQIILFYHLTQANFRCQFGESVFTTSQWPLKQLQAFCLMVSPSCLHLWRLKMQTCITYN